MLDRNAGEGKRVLAGRRQRKTATAAPVTNGAIAAALKIVKLPYWGYSITHHTLWMQAKGSVAGAMTHVQQPFQPRVLSIGTGTERGPLPPRGAAALPIHFGFAELKQETLRQTGADLVLSWLFCDRYDAYDVAHLLMSARFSGLYVAVAEALPNPSLVSREIRGCFPGLRFRLECPRALSREAARYHHVIDRASLSGELAHA